MKSVPFYSGSRFGNRELRGQEIFNWLRRLDLTRHVDRFLSAGVEELSVVSQLREEQLLMLGISDVHERLTLLHAIKLLQKHNKRTLPLKGTSRVNCPPGDIELNVFKCRNNFFYNNNGYHGSSSMGEDQEDEGGNYTECVDLNRTNKCPCEGEVNDEPSYEEVQEVPELQSNANSRFGAGQNNNWSREGVERVNSSLLLTLIKEKVIQDQIDLTRIDDESIMRRIAGQYAQELAVYLGLPSVSSCGGGGGTSFSSTSSSSSSGYVSSCPDLHPHVLNALRHLRASPSMWKVQNPQVIKRDSSEGSFIPGVYQPSSCLRNKDEIYDYVPPKVPSSFEKESRPRAESLKLNVGRYVSFQRGPEPINDGNGTTTYGFIRSTPRRSVGGSQQPTSHFSNSTFTISGSCSSSRTSPSCTSTDAYGFVSSSPSSTSDSHSQRDNKIGGERVGETLLRIGRRLGLSRLLKTLRLSEVPQNPNALRRVQSVPASHTPVSGSSSSSFRNFDHQLTSPNVSSQSEVSSMSCGERLPSNERIIETINRLKLRELHKRKERIAHEHRTMLIDCAAGEKDTIRASRKEDTALAGEHSKQVAAQRESPCTPSANGAFQGVVRVRQESPSESKDKKAPPSPSSNDLGHVRSSMKISSVDSVERQTSLRPAELMNPPTKNTDLDETEHHSKVEASALRDLLKRNDLEKYCGLLEKEGFETLELFVEVQEEDLLSLSITDPDHRGRLLSVAHSLRPSPPRLPCQTPYQWDYYATSARKERGVVAVEVHPATRSRTNSASNKHV